MIKEIKRNLRKLYNNLSWAKDVYVAKAPYHTLDLEMLDAQVLGQCLILAPHADDEWIGCSQVIQKAEKSYVYYFQFLGKNYNEQNRQTRLKEITQLCEKFDIRLIVSNSYENYDDLLSLIEENDFSYIFLPFAIDWHDEHIKVNHILEDCLSVLQQKDSEKFDRLKDRLLFYNISIPLPKQKIKYFPIKPEELEYKKNVFLKNYLSQHGTSIKRMNLQSRLGAKGTENYAIEPYAILDFDEWKRLLRFVETHSLELKELTHCIDNMQEVRRKADTIFHKFLKDK